ncbi:MAG: N-formylglutamate amidohydrolase, partial [Thiogranum sp.]
MLTLSEAGVIALIEQEETFECRLDDGSLTLKIEEYVPFLCTAIHQGHRLRTELVSICQLSAKERRFEEDPYTADLISSMPVTLVAEDSRYEYDLNRPLSQCIYQKAWGKKVWKKRLSDAQVARSHDKHRCFFRILDVLIGKLQQKFRGCIVFDVHSYNYQRLASGGPTLNLGTEQIDMERWGSVVKRFQKLLGQMQLPNIQVVAALNEVFYGRGYLIGHINGKFESTLVLPTEVKKVFMDELSGELFPLVLDEMKDGTKRAIAETAAFFARRHTRKTRARHQDMLSTT